MTIAMGLLVFALAFLGVVAVGVAIMNATKPRHPAHEAARHVEPRHDVRDKRPHSPAPMGSASAETTLPSPEHVPTAAPGFGMPDPMEGALRAKIRDRYIAARFPGIAKCSADLRNHERAIKAARLFFEEERGEAALELLALALEEDPACEPARLAQLELAFLLHDAALYSEAARALRQLEPPISTAP